MCENRPSGTPNRWRDAVLAAWARTWRGIHPGERIAVMGIGLWFLAVGVALWAALGEPPAWLDIPALVVLWIYGLGFFLIFGAPALFLPAYGVFCGLRQVLAPKRRAAEDEFGAEMDKAEAAIKEGHTESEAGKERGEDKPFRLASLGRKPYAPGEECKLPNLRRPLEIAAVVLVLALLYDGRFLLAALYFVPPLALYAAIGGAWVWQRLVLRRA